MDYNIIKCACSVIGAGTYFNTLTGAIDWNPA
jgi:hypothetical protein